MAYKIKSLLLLFLVCYCIDVQSQSKKQSRAYYFSFNGNDLNEGTVSSPYKSIGKIKDLELKQGDSILFKAKEVFIGNLLFENINAKILITSYGKGLATINGKNSASIV